MGCDIHCHVEIKIKGKWHHYNAIHIDRSYALFTKMAGVRNCENVKPISKPRGAPTDMSEVTRLDYVLWDGDGHSHSFLSGQEAGEVQAWYEKLVSGPHHSPVFGYLFGNNIDSLSQCPEESKELRLEGVEDVRLVFWFDN